MTDLEPAFTLHGTDVFVQGQGAQTLVFMHGWPDTYRLWDGAVSALQSQHRCVRFTFPGFEGPPSGSARSLADITALLLEIVDVVSPDRPVTLVLHDWGCIFGYELAARHPKRIARLVGVDIGDYNGRAYLKSLTAVQKLMILAYQLFLASAWVIGRFASAALGNTMTRWMARAMRCPTPAEGLHWFMNTPYAMTWFGVGGGLKSAARFKPRCPVLYVYGKHKPLMFQSPQWLAQCSTNPGSKAIGLPCGHWVMVEQAPEFEALLVEWLASDAS